MIDSPHNPRFKALALLTKGRGRDRSGQRVASLLRSDLERAGISADDRLLLLEGPNLVEAAVDAQLALPVTLASSRFLQSGHSLLSQIRPIEVEERLLAQFADADAPRGLVAVAQAPCQADLQAALGPSSNTLVYLDRIGDPKNLGAILRVAEASGVDAVCLSPGCARWQHPRALRASAGSALRLRLVDDLPAAAAQTTLSQQFEDWSWLALTAGGESLFDTAIPDRRILVLGSEAHGIAPDIRDICVQKLSIPMEGAVESLNVATAAAVALFDIQRRAPFAELQIGL